MTKGLERAWIYGRYLAYWEFNFVDNELPNRREAYEQILAETRGWA